MIKVWNGNCWNSRSTPECNAGPPISTASIAATRALHEVDFDPAGFEWIDCNDADASVVSLLRHGRGDNDTLLVVCNFTPVVRSNYRVGAPRGGIWRELLNSDAKEYGGSGVGNMGEVEAAPIPFLE